MSAAAVPAPDAVVRYRLARSFYAGDPYGSHAPALAAALPAAFALASAGGCAPVVLEVGCGSHSTPAILGFASGFQGPSRYIAVEHDPGCIDEIVSPLVSALPAHVRGLTFDLRVYSSAPGRETAMIDGYIASVREAANAIDAACRTAGVGFAPRRPAIAFLDSWPAAGRLPLLRELRKTFPIIVVHDTEPTGEYGLETELNSFRFRLDVTPRAGVGIYAKLQTPDPHPWTSVLSNSFDVTSLLAGYTVRMADHERRPVIPPASPTPAEPAD